MALWSPIEWLRDLLPPTQPISKPNSITTWAYVFHTCCYNILQKQLRHLSVKFSFGTFSYPNRYACLFPHSHPLRTPLPMLFGISFTATSINFKTGKGISSGIFISFSESVVVFEENGYSMRECLDNFGTGCNCFYMH